ncbi:MAG: prepilin-type N-terminal cleavage/methylation domain-containing protein [Phycisphaerae bacterium]|nr:prepilin-type N-terminal cleavage/methylation domain-containing protein [Phycisphaerae bacterium]MDD5381512.1 prepilin-type N-terminal cleavage/methylation domain-containing protein [Phycisphaerae bacterium]
MKIISYKIYGRRSGFSLAEVLVAMAIGAMVLVAVLGIYNRAETSAAAITRKLDSSRLPFEVLQRITEDLDRTAAPSDTKITVENKFENGFSTARLTILKTIYNDRNQKRTFEEIVWQTNYDNDANGLVLYRSHSGIAMEDKLLDEQKEDWERELFVPICTGVTFFKIQVPVGEELKDDWTSDSLPPGIVVTISFAEPFKTLTGVLDIPENEKIVRNMAIDRTRANKFVFAKKEGEEKKR